MYRIKDWYRLFENNRTRELKHMDWVPVPNKMDGTGYTELVDHPNAAAHLGAWLAIIEIASRQKVRGNFPQVGAGIPQSVEGMSKVLCRISRLPNSVFEELIPRLLKMEWIERFQQVDEIPQVGAVIPQVGAVIPQVGAGPSRDTRAVTEGNGIVIVTPPTPSCDELQEVSDGFDRHLCHGNREGRDIVIQHVLSMNGKFSWEKFRANHGPYCEYWSQKGWNFCKLTFLGWINAGMPPPTGTATNQPPQQATTPPGPCGKCGKDPCVCHRAKHAKMMEDLDRAKTASI